MSSSSSGDPISELLRGLGKATRRGVRKCPKCGTQNGTRGLSCKNRSCDMVFKEGGVGGRTQVRATGRGQAAWTCCRLITGERRDAEDAPSRSALHPTPGVPEPLLAPEDRLCQIYSLGSDGPESDEQPEEERGFITVSATTASFYSGSSWPSMDDGDPDADAEVTSQPATLHGQRTQCFFRSCQAQRRRSRMSCDRDQPDQPPAPCAHLDLFSTYRPHTSSSSDAPETFAVPLLVKQSVLNQMSISGDLKHEIWLGARQDGPLVQRVSARTMVVKCQPDERHPLGYLHVSFDLRGAPRVTCSCNPSPLSSPHDAPNADLMMMDCLHFYACVAVFASDEHLTEEFGIFVTMLLTPQPAIVIDGSLDDDAGRRHQRHVADDEDSALNQVITILGHDGDTIQVEILDEDRFNLLTLQADEEGEEEASTDVSQVLEANLTQEDMAASTADFVLAGLDQAAVINHHQQRQPTTSQVLSSCPSPLPLEPSSSPAASNGVKRKRASSAANKIVNAMAAKQRRRRSTHTQQTEAASGSGGVGGSSSSSEQDETMVHLSFSDWLASVTERINQTMHFQFHGQPDPLVFHAPQAFFNCLRERMSVGGGGGGDSSVGKKRLPNSTCTFVRKDSLPLGTFTKYTWRIHNLLQLKQIFDTSRVSLDMSRVFVDNGDGTYDPVSPPASASAQENGAANKTRNTASSYKRKRQNKVMTFLKVGQMSSERKDAFIIEWIPDILPTMNIGELRIIFQYGHQRTGLIELKNTDMLRY